MPVVHRDAKKRARQNLRRAARNQMIKSSLKTAAKKFLAAVAAQDKDKAMVLYKQTSGLYDRAAAAGHIHRNAAARKKSRLRLKLNAIGTEAATKSGRRQTGRSQAITPAAGGQ
jgi:small subunit ribosomal protein S20